MMTRSCPGQVQHERDRGEGIRRYDPQSAASFDGAGNELEYRLRRATEINRTGEFYRRGSGDEPDGSFPEQRAKKLGAIMDGAANLGKPSSTLTASKQGSAAA